MASTASSNRAALEGYPCGWQWEREGADWPLRAASRRIECAGLSWHVQRLGEPAGRPMVLLLHGTFSSTHSWSGLALRLARHYQLLMPDLPGHGWTFGARPEDMAMTTMTGKLHALLRALDVTPEVIVGHSAGAALAVSMALESSPVRVLSLNGALLPLAGLGGKLYAPAAQLLQFVPGLARFSAWRSAQSDVVDRLLEGTGSQLGEAQVQWYRRLASDPGHVAAVMEMMARWDLAGFARRLATYQGRLDLVAGSRDTTVPASELRRIVVRVPQARCHVLRDLGHLAHEEDPETVAELVLGLLGR